MDLNYLELIKKSYPSLETVYTELINLEAIQNLPKGTELYLSDIHGAHDKLTHILSTGAGNIKEKLFIYFRDKLDSRSINQLNLLIGYPIYFWENNKSLVLDNIWCKKTIINLIDFMKFCSVKYTRSKVRKALPKKYTYIIEELLYTDLQQSEKDSYYHNIINRLIELNQSEPFILALCAVIKQLVIDHLHIVGDIFDRSQGEDKVMEELMKYHSVDIQWGNHDILWMGAKFGSLVNLITLLRIAARYGYLFNLEKIYGLNLRPLFMYANDKYNYHSSFEPKKDSGTFEKENEILLNKVHQCLAIIQFKLENQIIIRRPEFKMSKRAFLKDINKNTEEVIIDKKVYKLNKFPYDSLSTINPINLFKEEKVIIKKLMESYQQSEKIERYMDFLLNKGSMYLKYNNHLLFHGCIPMDNSGDFQEVIINNEGYSGKNLLERLETSFREASKRPKISDDLDTDLLWYAWSGPRSPLFGRDRMTTFERYYIQERSSHREQPNSYFKLRENEKIIEKVLQEFGCCKKESKIINGHTPIEVKKGENPIKANSKLIVIDGGMNKAYQKKTGVAGYSLLNNSYGFQLVTHQPFISIEDIFLKGEDETILKHMIDGKNKRKLIKNTTIGEKIQNKIDYLITVIDHLQ